jgi:exo-beta-1,3-glucanase (GH17 family)/cellulose synthase/poly-beta-1,6-N-acetylglucosamine synthase-like glycosyltransferase
MNRSGLFITLIMGCLAALLWMLVNSPDIEPPWPTMVQGFSFSPYRTGQSAEGNNFPTEAEIEEDLALLAGDTHAVRSYSVKGTLAEIPRLAASKGLNVVLGAWISNIAKDNEEEIQKLIKVYRAHHRNIVRVIVGNETLLRTEQTVPQMIEHLERVRKSVWAPVSCAEPWHIWLEHPELVKHVDFIAVHLLPYWEGISIDEAVNYVVMRYNELRKAYPDKQIIITEVGWPSNGRTRNQAVASQENQAKFLRRFLATAEKNGYTYYIMEAFDQVWKKSAEGQAGAHWGVYNDKRLPKFSFRDPLVKVPQWRDLAAISIALSVVILLLLFRDSGTMKTSGRGFLAIVAFSITTFAVWIVYDFSQQYMSPGGLAVGIILFLAALGAIVVILAEAHEWAEALWTRNWRRLPMPSADQDETYRPMVSVHVPAYNEPPDMLKQTLDALAALDYPNFEVLVIDNNTKDPAVWQPVEAYCRELGPRFRFFHVEPLAGFKAGALNFALKETAAEAEIVAVIDSDYIVTKNWLQALVPQFKDERMAIVQAPQDYRDDMDNAFKAMCNVEYRGFFDIGMVTRNERNAIIQHGTMTLVRRSVLDEVGGWAEWCITEDAELGLRIFERGYDATYLPHSYGQGLMPDTFLDYKKQRFRWAYGAVIIIRRHLMKLIGLDSTNLTLGQRYHFIAGWLPWFADGINLLFNFMALAWSVGMCLFPSHVAPPHIIFAILPLTLFVFKSVKMFFLYRRRVSASLLQSFAAGLAGLALSHVIARAMLTGFITRGIGFFRTPKRAKANALLQSLIDAREELLFLIALGLSAYAVQIRPDGTMLDIRVWALVLIVQSVPYAAAVIVSLISGMPWLSARLVGKMRPLASTGHK